MAQGYVPRVAHPIRSASELSDTKCTSGQCCAWLKASRRCSLLTFRAFAFSCDGAAGLGGVRLGEEDAAGFEVGVVGEAVGLAACAVLAGACGTSAEPASNASTAVVPSSQTTVTAVLGDGFATAEPTASSLSDDAYAAQAPVPSATSQDDGAGAAQAARGQVSTSPKSADESPALDGDAEIDREVFPEATFPEASVRDPETEAADLERRRSVIGLFERLRVTVEHRSGYDREALFGGWLYSGGLSTRDQVLREEQRGDGFWLSVYDAVVVTEAAQLDIDHLVPLSEAWESGGYLWTESTWTRYANDLGDPRSLIAVSASTNRSKGARDPAEWWPPSSSYRCQYAADWVAVKSRWNLSVDAAERDALEARIDQCAPDQFEFDLPQSVEDNSE